MCKAVLPLALFVVVCSFEPLQVHAVTITNYSATVNNRFSGGFPTTPTPNTDPTFIGIEYDWSGVAWSTTTYSNSSYKGFGLLSPIHFLTAQHYEHGPDFTQGLRILGNNSTVYTEANQSVSNLQLGMVLNNRNITAHDLAIGTLEAPIAPPNAFFRHGILDLHNSSSSDSLGNYDNIDIFLYGRSNTTNGSPRIGATTIEQTYAFNDDPTQIIIRTTRNDVQLQVGDSGAPAFHGWQNPNNEMELSVLGTNSAINNDLGFNYISMLATTAAINASNDLMTTKGFALRMNGNPSTEWEGGSGGPMNNNNLGFDNNWSSSTINDRYVLFDGNATTFHNPNVNANINLRGIYFKSTASTDAGFTFQGNNMLTIGRGGITNYDISRQTFNAPITLGDHQYWDVGPGGITVNTINTNGNLLEIAGTGNATINGEISGSGGIALSGQRLTITGNSTYSGTTWVHSGRLEITGDISSSSEIMIAENGEVSGTGTVSILSGGGSVHPGESPGILTADSVNPSGGLSFFFEFTQLGSPNYGNSSDSGNDVLRLTASSPFLSPLGPTNTVSILFNLPGELAFDDILLGGFYADESITFDSSILDANFVFYVADAGGSLIYDGISYSEYSGSLAFQISTTADTADFASGEIEGYSMEILVIPEMETYSLILGLIAILTLARKRLHFRYHS